jgi:hypothetical protein
MLAKLVNGRATLDGQLDAERQGSLPRLPCREFGGLTAKELSYVGADGRGLWTKSPARG